MNALPNRPSTVLLKDCEGDIGLIRVLAPDPTHAIACALAGGVASTGDDEGRDAEEALDEAEPVEMEREVQGVVEGHSHDLFHHGYDLREHEDRIVELRDAAACAVLDGEDDNVRHVIGQGPWFPKAVPA